jgi:ankyrin repeat protein
MSNKNNNNNNSTEKKVAHFENLLRDGKKKEAKDFLKNNLNINAKIDDSGKTLLMDVVMYLDKSSVELVLEEGANIHAKDNHGDTAMDYALNIGDKYIINLLEKHGAKVDNKLRKNLKNNNNKNKNKNKNKNNNNTRRRFLNRINPSLRKINLGNTRKVRKH